MKALLLLIISLLFCRVAEAREFRDLTNNAGVTIHAELLDAEWHELVIRTKDDTTVVLVDSEEVGTLTSDGISHATKSQVSLTTNVNDVHYDDFVVKAAPDSGSPDDKENE